MRITFKPTESIELKIFWALLQVDFIHLKLAKAIDWNWFWVLSPTLGIILIGGGIIATLLIIAGIKR